MPHIHELYDFVITVFIVHEDKVLLVNHPRYSKWIGMGGHIELDEDPEQALFREIQEETGLEVEILSHKPGFSSPNTKILYPPNFFDVHDANLPHRHIALIYFAKAKSANAVLSSEHTELKWFNKAELQDERYKLEPSVIFYAEHAINAARNGLV
jgi:8-oxo-dGTP diphosphatase